MDAARVGGGGGRLAVEERRLRLFLHALWGRAPDLRPLLPGPGAALPRRGRFSGTALWLPVDLPGAGPGAGLVYRAAAAHMAAHLAYGGAAFAVGGLKPLQVALVSLVEDARVEQLALARYPGLGRLWRAQHVAQPGGAGAAALLARLARALLDPAYADGDPWVEKGRAMFFAARAQWGDPAISRRIGDLLGNDLGQMRVPFDARAYVVEPAYRDDNSGLWEPAADEGAPAEDASLAPDGAGQQPEEQEQEPAGTGSGAEPQAWRVEDGTGPEAGPVRYHYPEWDFLIGRLRPDWCTVVDQPAQPGDPARVAQLLDRHAPLVRRIEALVRRLALQHLVRLRRRLDGDALDLDACIRAAVDLRLGQVPDPRVHRLLARERRDLAVLVLLDLSRSTNDPVAGTGDTILGLACDATALLAQAMQQIGDRFAIHGFWSNTRRQVDYFRVKDFAQPFALDAQARLAGLRGDFSTRMGAALRHAGGLLRRQPGHAHLLLLVTDGAPSDVDVHDPRYLRADTRHAVLDLRRRGMQVHCLSLDAHADDYVSGIFGPGHFTVLDHLERLPEKLPHLYLRLTA